MMSHTPPPLYTRLEAQIEELKKRGRTRHIDQLAISEIAIFRVEHDGSLFYITVEIDSKAVDFTTDDNSGEIISGDSEENFSTRYLTFLRSENAKTPDGDEKPISNHCPNCGAPVNLNALGQCQYCGSDITSGAYSWILSEISDL